MNIIESDILLELYKNPYTSQRELAFLTGYSLGLVNRILRELKDGGYICHQKQLTTKSYELIKKSSPKKAIILAAGFGIRMIPINFEQPKAFIEIDGEILIERLIRQLHEVDIREIIVVVGFMKEKFEYLIDEFGVTLVVNSQYSKKNNLFSLGLVRTSLANSYIIPSDLWFATNPFRKRELSSWYMVTESESRTGFVKCNKKLELLKVSQRNMGHLEVGVAYLLSKDADLVKNLLERLSVLPQYDDKFWEESLFLKNKMIVPARIFPSTKVKEINTYEQLRAIDDKSSQLEVESIEIIEKYLNTDKNYISDIAVLKKGMTNRSFLFMNKNQKYIMRIPGEGTDKLINRNYEAEVYGVIKKKNIADNVLYINPDNGYKISEFLPNVRTCNSRDWGDVKRCIKFLKKFHDMELKVKHRLDLFEQIEFYETLWENYPSVYSDYSLTKEKVFSLKKYIDKNIEKQVLTHIDSVSDNFLFINEEQEVRLIDWEYAAMQDPHVDISMFCIYALYSREEVDRVIDLYFSNECPFNIRIKIYCYISVCGLLWSNWCEYKQRLGVEFGEYSLKQYRYAKDYYNIVQKELDRRN